MAQRAELSLSYYLRKEGVVKDDKLDKAIAAALAKFKFQRVQGTTLDEEGRRDLVFRAPEE